MRRGTAWRLSIAVTAGFVVHLLLFVASKDESDPSVCYSLFDYEVPCGNFSYAAAAVTACVVYGLLVLFGFLLRRTDVRPPDQGDGPVEGTVEPDT